LTPIHLLRDALTFACLDICGGLPPIKGHVRLL
jgi:hypothetical protein